MTEKKKKSAVGEIWVRNFTEDAAAEFRNQVIEVVMKNQEHPIVIYIDSYGGAVDALAKMIDTLEQVPNPIVTCCMGKAMSCGAILLSYGHYRYCAPNSRVLVHEVSAGTGGCVHDMKNDAEEAQRLNKHFLGMLAKNCGIKRGYEGFRKVIKNHDGRDLWMNADKALAFGIVDEVGTPVILPMVAYEIATIEPPTRKQRVDRIKDMLGG